MGVGRAAADGLSEETSWRKGYLSWDLMMRKCRLHEDLQLRIQAGTLSSFKFLLAYPKQLDKTLYTGEAQSVKVGREESSELGGARSSVRSRQ